MAGIPTLVIIDEKGEVITKNGRGAVSLDPDGEVMTNSCHGVCYKEVWLLPVHHSQEFPWYPKPVMVLSETTAGDLNDTASLIWFVPEDSLEKAKELLEPLAKSHISKWSEEKADPEMLFYVSTPGGDSDEIRESLRSFAKLKSDDLQLVVVDIPDQKVNHTHLRPLLVAAV